MGWKTRTDPAIVNDPTYLEPRITAVEVENDDLNTQLTDHVKYKKNEVTTRFQNTVKPIITFVSDDGDPKDDEVLKPMFTAEGVPCVVAMVSSRIGTYLSLQQLLEFQSLGWEIASHTHNHSQLPTLSDADLDFDLSESYRLLNTNGLKCKNLCIPYGAYDNRVKQFAQKYYRGVRGSEQGYNYINDINNLNIFSRPTEFEDLATCKSYVDEIESTNAWGVFLFHSYTTCQNQTQIDNLRAVIQYIKSKGIEIVTLHEGLNRYANNIEIGANAEFKVTQQGEIVSGQVNSLFLSDDAVTAATSITSFKDNTCSIVGINANRTDFPDSRPGMLYTHKFTNMPLYWHQIYVLSGNSKEIYKRYCDANKVWQPWVLIANTNSISLPLNGVTSDALYTQFENGRLTYCIISNAGASTFPEAKAGMLTTFRLNSETGYSYQEYRIYGSNTMYKRFAKADGTWDVWANQAPPSPLTRTLTKDSVNNDSLPNAFSNGSISYCVISSATPSVSRPLGKSGTLMTCRLDADYGWCYQEHVVYATNEKYFRTATSGTAWNAWQKVTLV